MKLSSHLEAKQARKTQCRIVEKATGKIREKPFPESHVKKVLQEDKWSVSLNATERSKNREGTMRFGHV